MAKRFNIYRISESEEWSTINLYPQFPKNVQLFECDVLCSVNGWFCLCCIIDESYLQEEYFLWNPETNKVRLIPHPDSSYFPCTCLSRRCIKYVSNSGCGLGFDAESQDYKFVRFISYFNDSDHDSSHDRLAHVVVYSYKHDSWKELPFPVDRDNRIDSFLPKVDLFEEEYPVATCVNGFCYWRTSMDVILSFELSSDNFSTLPYPDDIAQDNFSIEKDVFLIELDGSLGLVIQKKKEKKKKAIPRKLFSFWVYEYKGLSSSPWTRKINLDVCLDAEKPLWLGKKNNGGEFLLLQGIDGALLEYDYSRRELKKIDQIHDHRKSRVIISANYFETNNANIAENKINSTCEFDGWKAHLRPHSKCGNDDVVMDRISQLPDEIKLTILSLLSIKEAASTSVLSTRWSDLWRYIPNLVFHNTDRMMLMDKHKKYTKCVNSIVESHKALSFKEFNIAFPLDYSTRRTLTKWLEFAFSRGVEVLVLNLVGKKFTLLEKTFQRKSTLLNSTNLTSLCLKCLEVSGEAIGLFLRNCPLLERLIIKYVLLTSDLEVCSGVLKHLDIQYCRGENSIRGYAPNLTYLRIDSSPKLVWDCTQSFISSPLTTLEFALHRPEIFLEKEFPEMPTLRKLSITYYGCKHSILPLMTSFICALPYLEEFEIKQQHYKWKFFENQGVEAVNNVGRFCHPHLRVFKFIGFNVCDGDHMELMSYILDNCVALQKIVLPKYAADSPSHVAYWEYVKQLHSKLPSHIQLITS